MAFIDRYQVEKAGREMPVRLPVSLRPADRPVESGADLEGRVDAARPADGGVDGVDLVVTAESYRYRRRDSADGRTYRLRGLCAPTAA